MNTLIELRLTLYKELNNHKIQFTTFGRENEPVHDFMIGSIFTNFCRLRFYRCWKSLKINYSLNKHEFFQNVNIIHFALLWLFIYTKAVVDGLIVPFGVMQDQDEQICILAHQRCGAATGSLYCFFNNFNVCIRWRQKI